MKYQGKESMFFFRMRVQRISFTTDDEIDKIPIPLQKIFVSRREAAKALMKDSLSPQQHKDLIQLINICDDNIKQYFALI